MPANPLESRLVLHSYLCNQFGYKNLREILDQINNFTTSAGSATQFLEAISRRLSQGSLTENDLLRYNNNILTHSETLKMGNRNIFLKPFQYIALLFTERYLDMYFSDKSQLIEQLNHWNEKNFKKYELEPYTPLDITTLAFQSATGSGKTLLMHANILQYVHYLDTNRIRHKLNKIILVTPDESLSRQHLNEMRLNNIDARIFKLSQLQVLPSSSICVDIIDLHKLDEKMGTKRIALNSFGDNNLVVVDEGHLGTGGKVWRSRRKQLADNGFTFEYSATFNQAVSGANREINHLRNEYGKSIIFDYSYKHFYADGYGKDYRIYNLQDTDDAETNRVYLLASLLTFYQQVRIFKQSDAGWKDFNLTHPLWMFLGRTVTGGTSAAEENTVSDIVSIINFLAWVLANPSKVISNTKKLLYEETIFRDQNESNIFAFPFIKDRTPEEIIGDLYATIFHGKGNLQISRLTGGDEIHLKVANSKPFGVINVGDASKLCTILRNIVDPEFILTENIFEKPLFGTIDNVNSPINIIVGARKFVAGWNSWRVSTMSLMHVGSGEGPQIIQMFGRGVRLKGHSMSLKRHTALQGVTPQFTDELKLLETLNIFGLKANYMDKFREYLQKEDIDVDRVSLTIPTKWQFEPETNLKILEKQDNIGEFQFSENTLVLPAKPTLQDIPILDLYVKLESLDSNSWQSHDTENPKEKFRFESKHLALVNKQRIYYKVLETKRRSKWYNLEISNETVESLLDKTNKWYELKIPQEKLNSSSFAVVREWEDILVKLISTYADNFWRRKRATWEHEYLTIVPLTEDSSNNIKEYELLVSKSEETLVEDITEWCELVNTNGHIDNFSSGNIHISILAPSFHAYTPLLFASIGKSSGIQIIPIPLNEGESSFVRYLLEVVEDQNIQDTLKGKEIYLMRNQSHSKGISFFNDNHFYPDFILWIKDEKIQNMLFVDPKGLSRFDSIANSKVKLHHKIKETQRKIQEKSPNVFLHSYIWSVTHAKDIGTEVPKSIEKWKSEGVYFEDEGREGIRALLLDALAASN